MEGRQTSVNPRRDQLLALENQPSCRPSSPMGHPREVLGSTDEATRTEHESPDASHALSTSPRGRPA